MTDILCVNEIKKYLLYDVDILLLDSIDSTNSYLKLNADSFCDNTLIIAKEQTGGRGRFARKFHSPENSGIYMSLLLKSPLKPSSSILITTAAAVAVAQACEKLSDNNALIKWVNDIYINERKVCGILCEGALTPDNQNMEFAVLGIGINAYKPLEDFHNEIKDIAGAVFTKREENLRNLLIAEILNNFYAFYKNLESKPFLEEYKSRSFVIGKNVNVIKLDRITPAKVLDIDNDLRLLVQYKSGETEALSSGEISIKI